MARRGNGEGTITKRKDGRWEAKYTVYTPSGKKRKAVYAKTRREAAAKLAEAMGSAARGIVFDSRNATVGEYLERWLDDVVKPNTAHRTYSTHRQQIDSHIAPTVGGIKLEALRKAHIDGLYARLLAERPAGSGLAPSSVRRVHAVLHGALEEAVRGDLIPRNPAAHANKPKVRHAELEREPLDTEQADAFLAAAEEDRYEALYVLCLQCALRQGEALALKWADINLDIGSAYIIRQLQRRRGENGQPGRLEFYEPKNASLRKVGLPQRSVSALRIHRKRQAEEKLQAGSLYSDQGLVFANGTGGPLDAQNVVNRHFKPLLQKADLPPIRFHDLRHSCLSLLAQKGVPIRDLQALAGHASAAFTLQRYTHHYGTSAAHTATAMDEVLPQK